MKIFDENKSAKIKDRELRYKIVKYILIFMMLALIAKLFQLTILKGNEFRSKSDNNRLKDIQVVAPRGTIYDKNGKILAGVKATSTVRIFKDDFNRLSKEEKISTIDNLIKLLNRDGASWDSDDYFVSLNNFTFVDYSDYFTELKSPKEKVLDIIFEKNLIEDILKKKVENTDEYGSFYIIKKVVRDLQFKGIIIPTNSFEVETGDVSFADNEEGKKYIEEHKITTDLYKYVYELIKEDKSIIRKLLDQPISRKLIWEVLEEKKLTGNLQLEKYVDVNKHGYIVNKADLNKISPKITLESSTQDDFYNIVRATTLDKLLSYVNLDKDKNKTVPVEILIKILKEKGINPQVKYELVTDDTGKEVVQFSYENNEKSSIDPINHLITLAEQNEVLYKFILRDDIKYIAQKVNTENNVIPKILISNEKDKGFQYSYDKNYDDIKIRYRIKEDFDGKKLFEILKNFYEIQDLDDYSACSYLTLIRKLELQGNKAYVPINLSYGVSESCMSNIKEKFLNNQGIGVSMEPVRFYPNGSVGAHILGYIGKISQEEEKEKYTEKNGYSLDSLIGKTGIEESQELNLKGTDGFKRVLVDNRGNRTETITEKSAVPGKNVYLSIDLELQKVAEKALENAINSVRTGSSNNSKWGNYTPRETYKNARSGAVVVLDVKTGKVLALSSYPSYDPNLFSTGISNSDWVSLFPEDPRDFLAPRPLYNIATQSISQPGSTFKLATSLAALEKGMSPNEQINCQGVIDLGDTKFGCWIWNQYKRTHGPENLYTALRDSCNYYYYALALGKNPKNKVDTSVRVEVDDLIKTATELGLGSRTGIEINIPRESKGVVPNPNTKKDVTKALLKKMLEQNVEKYILKDSHKDDYDFPEVISKIVSWIDSPTLLTREQVSKNLTELKLRSEEVLDGTKETLTDIIKYTYLNQAKWDNSDALNSVIGQGQNSYTPIQMARFMAIFANGGYKVKASVIDKTVTYDNKEIVFENKPEPEKINFNNDKNLQYILEGMRRASKIKTNWEIYKDLPVEIGNKTGTAQKSGVNPVTGELYDNYAWTVAFAPFNNPEIAIATVIFQGGSGTYCGPVIRDVVGQYIDGKGDDFKRETPVENKEESQNGDSVGD